MRPGTLVQPARDVEAVRCDGSEERVMFFALGPAVVVARVGVDVHVLTRSTSGWMVDPEKALEEAR